MTYNTHPIYGVNEAAFGMASYAQAQFIQHEMKLAGQEAFVGRSAEEPILEGFEKIVYKPEGVTTTSLGAAEYVNGQTLKRWTDGPEEEEDDLDEDDLDNGDDGD